MRELLAYDVDVSSLLPPDEKARGFDNMSDALTITPSLVQAYVRAAGRISRGGRSQGNGGLFRYPLSYLIYGAQFEALPEVVRAGVYRRLREILTAPIWEILTETKPELGVRP